jgi:hypothetical protein
MVMVMVMVSARVVGTHLEIIERRLLCALRVLSLHAVVRAHRSRAVELTAASNGALGCQAAPQVSGVVVDFLHV